MRSLVAGLWTKCWAKWVMFALCSILLLTIAKMNWTSRFSYGPNSIELAHGPEAPSLSPSVLMARPVKNSTLSVPRLIHQSWKSRTLPAKFDIWARTCRKKHPDWEWVLWTDEDNLNLIKIYFPWLLPAYNKLPGPIYRADLARNAYMYLFGGVYADLDTECLRPSNSIFEEYNVSTVPHIADRPPLHTSWKSNSNNTKLKAFFGQMGSDEAFGESIPNAWMASSPGHPFFLQMLYWVHKNVTSSSTRFNTEDLTGPGALRSRIKEYEKEMNGAVLLEEYQNKQLFSPSHTNTGHEIVLLPSWYIYPYSWSREGKVFRDVCSAERRSFNPVRCKDLIHVDRLRSYTITYWSHSWTYTGSNWWNVWAISS